MVFHSPKDKDLSKPPEGEENQAQQHSDAEAAASAQAAQQEKQEVVETEKTDMQMAESILKKGNSLGLIKKKMILWIYLIWWSNTLSIQMF